MTQVEEVLARGQPTGYRPVPAVSQLHQLRALQLV